MTEEQKKIMEKVISTKITGDSIVPSFSAIARIFFMMFMGLSLVLIFKPPLGLLVLIIVVSSIGGGYWGVWFDENIDKN